MNENNACVKYKGETERCTEGTVGCGTDHRSSDDWRRVATNRRHQIADLEEEIAKLKEIAEAAKAYIENQDDPNVDEFEAMEKAVKAYYADKREGS